MAAWLSHVLALLLGLFSAPAAPPADFVGTLAAEGAYITLAYPPPPVSDVPDDDTPVMPDGPTKTCPQCKGKKRVPSGDDQGDTKCPTCRGLGVVPVENVTAAPPAPGCEDGKCPAPKVAPKTTPAGVFRPYPSPR